MTTTLSFRLDDSLARQLDDEARRIGSTRSELLQQAVTDLLYRRACERDADIYDRLPMTATEVGGRGTDGWVDDAPGTDWESIFGA